VHHSLKHNGQQVEEVKQELRDIGQRGDINTGRVIKEVARRGEDVLAQGEENAERLEEIKASVAEVATKEDVRRLNEQFKEMMELLG
jgi:hypothetical protein